MNKVQRILLIAASAVFLMTQADAIMYFARPYDPNLQRWIARDPLGDEGSLVRLSLKIGPQFEPMPNYAFVRGPFESWGGGNLYNFVANNPVNAIDPLGLSPADVARLTALSQAYTAAMTQSGQRLNGGDWNNLNSAFESLFGHPSPYLGCGQQADALASFLNGTGTDDQWLIYNMEINIYHLPGYHQLLIAQSSNPNDPMLYLDPWNNTFGPRPPALFYLGPVTPSINIGGNQNSTLPVGFHPGNGPYIVP